MQAAEMDVKAAIRLLWKDRASVIEYQEYQEENKSTSHKEVIVLENELCKLSFETLKSTIQTDSAAVVVQTAKLFIDERLEIKAGSKIVVTQTATGKVFEFGQSGQAGIFENHQEIPLVPFEVYA
jgi:hypothetical protein